MSAFDPFDLDGVRDWCDCMENGFLRCGRCRTAAGLDDRDGEDKEKDDGDDSEAGR